MQVDIVNRLRHLADLYHSSSMEAVVAREAASEIERLRPAATTPVEASPRPKGETTGVDELDEVLKRIAEPESRVRLTQHRLAAAAQMCADIDRDPRVHISVQACFSHVGKALESEPQEDDGHV